MNARQKRRAAKLYALAQVAHLDEGGCDTETQMDVVSIAVEMARQKLEAMGEGWSGLNSLEACMEAAKARV